MTRAYKTSKTYRLSDGQIVTCQQVADKIGATLSAARNRLNRSNDPEKVFLPCDTKKISKHLKIKTPKPKPKAINIRPYDDEMFRLALKKI
jgi:hypothetical protein|tara:strand:+ start:155 stop:427 length:273 start_codon:yes stop_codon:yes gene_type:complete